jgi:hypothetical protein
MNNGRDVFVLSGTRTAIGQYGAPSWRSRPATSPPPWCARRSAGPARSQDIAAIFERA